MNGLTWFAGALGSGLLGVILTVLFQEQIQFWLAAMLSHLRGSRKRGVEGEWKATFVVTRNAERSEYVEVIRISSALGVAQGYIVPHEYNYPALRAQEVNRPLRLRGEIGEGFYFTGTWFHPLDTHRFRGAFQLLIDPSGRSMRGMWIGFSETLGTIDSGEWLFERLAA